MRARGGRPPPRGGLIAGDRFDLQRFTAAQAGGVYDRALAELRAGRKTGHWMWFVFPQLDGLGSSPTARRYAISGLAEARAYLADPLLGARLRECCEALLTLPADVAASDVLGGIDALKLRSSLTLFLRAGEPLEWLQSVLDRFYGGRPDPATDRLLAQNG